MPVGKQSQNQLSALARSEPWLMTAWEKVHYDLQVVIQRMLDLPQTAGSYTAAAAVAAAVPASKCYSEKHFEHLNKIYSAELLNGTLVYLAAAAAAAAELVVECGKVADDSENDFLGERRNSDVAAGE